MKTTYELRVVIDHGAEEDDRRIRADLEDVLTGLRMDPQRTLTGSRIVSVSAIDRLTGTP